MSSAAKQAALSGREYLEIERAAEFKSELLDGRMRAMSGASRPHNLIAGNLFASLNVQLKGRPCEVYISDMRVCIDPSGDYTYPDIVAVCGEPRFLDGQFDTLTSPQVIIEILSPSTEAHDRGDKFALFQSLASLREYILVAQHKVRVERYSRRDDGWLPTTWDSLEGILSIESIGCQVVLSDIYARVAFPDPARPIDP